MKRKEKFILRVCISSFLCILFTLALPVPFYNAAYSSLLFVLIFSSTLFALKFCFDESRGNIIYVGFFSYNEQHISFQLYKLFCIPLGINSTENLYGSESGEANGLSIFVFIIPHVIVYLASWATLALRAYKSGKTSFHFKNNKIFIVAILIVVVNAILNAFVVYDLPEDIGNNVNYIIIFYNIFCCFLSLFMLLSLISRDELEYELKMVDNLWHKNEQIYQLSKVNVDFINMKCHDLRHRLRNARQKEFVDEKELKEIEHAIDIYDSIVKTGNDVLDVILSEESIYCIKNNIKLICSIDGTLLNFMEKVDIYSVFQNAIHNSIDAVMKLDDVEKRVIRITGHQRGELITIHIENYYDSSYKIVFVDDLPITTNKDKTLHGLGMKSMKRSIEKYNGYLNINTSGDIFSLDMLIPKR